MASDLWQQLSQRLTKAVRKSFEPCPLIGEKWLKEYPNGRPADLRYFGIPKLSKATGKTPERTMQAVLKNISFKGLPVAVSTTDDFLIDFVRTDKPQTSSGNSPASKSAAKGKPAAGKAKAGRNTAKPAGRKPAAKKKPARKPPARK